MFSDCPPCYSLVQERVNIHRRKVNELRELIKNVKENPKSVNDTEFRRQLQAVNQTVNDLLSDAKNAVGKEALNNRKNKEYRFCYE